MNKLNNTIKKEFTPNHRENYINYNKSNIFNNGLIETDNDIVSVKKIYFYFKKKYKNKFKEFKYEPKYENEKITAFTRKLSQFHNQQSIENGLYKKISINQSQVFIKPQFDDYTERKNVRDLTPKEKKILEQNPNLEVFKIKVIKDRKFEEIKEKRDNSIKFDFNQPNCAKISRIKLNASNIFYQEVFLNYNI